MHSPRWQEKGKFLYPTQLPCLPSQGWVQEATLLQTAFNEEAYILLHTHTSSLQSPQSANTSVRRTMSLAREE